ncbi:MAG: ankyrin repeat domain-containing protein [Armatimonadota bacterium]
MMHINRWRALWMNMLLVALMLLTIPLSAAEESIITAAKNGDVATVERLLKTKATLISIVDPQYGGTPLHWAATEGKDAIVQLLIAHGALINTKNKIGQTPLHLAVATGKESTVNLLLANGAGVNMQDSSGNTPLHYAYAMDKRSIMHHLKQVKADETMRNNRRQVPRDLLLPINLGNPKEDSHQKNPYWAEVVMSIIKAEESKRESENVNAFLNGNIKNQSEQYYIWGGIEMYSVNVKQQWKRIIQFGTIQVSPDPFNEIMRKDMPTTQDNSAYRNSIGERVEADTKERKIERIKYEYNRVIILEVAKDTNEIEYITAPVQYWRAGIRNIARMALVIDKDDPFQNETRKWSEIILDDEVSPKQIIWDLIDSLIKDRKMLIRTHDEYGKLLDWYCFDIFYQQFVKPNETPPLSAYGVSIAIDSEILPYYFDKMVEKYGWGYNVNYVQTGRELYTCYGPIAFGVDQSRKNHIKIMIKRWLANGGILDAAKEEVLSSPQNVSPWPIPIQLPTTGNAPLSPMVPIRIVRSDQTCYTHR